MPKYIRTEKGIYEVVEDSNKEWGKQIVVKFPKNLNMKLADVKDQIIKQADTIEELCDEFVVCYKDKKPFTSIHTEIKNLLKEHNLSECEIYGAIWTSKGLIYVAKMDNEGKLVLIWVIKKDF